LECAANKLTRLPSSVAELADLRVLDVSGNSLTALPDNIGQLVKLEHLRASGNRLAAVSYYLFIYLFIIIIKDIYIAQVRDGTNALCRQRWQYGYVTVNISIAISHITSCQDG